MSTKRVKIVIECEFDDWWISEEEEKKLSDEQIIELAREDVLSLIERGEIKVVRS